MRLKIASKGARLGQNTLRSARGGTHTDFPANARPTTALAFGVPPPTSLAPCDREQTALETGDLPGVSTTIPICFKALHAASGLMRLTPLPIPSSPGT